MALADGSEFLLLSTSAFSILCWYSANFGKSKELVRLFALIGISSMCVLVYLNVV